MTKITIFPMMPERYCTYHYHLGCGRVGGYPDCSSSLHARFFPMTPERYISLPFRLGLMMMMMMMMMMIMMTMMILPGPGKRWRFTVNLLNYRLTPHVLSACPPSRPGDSLYKVPNISPSHVTDHDSLFQTMQLTPFTVILNRLTSWKSDALIANSAMILHIFRCLIFHW